MKPAVMNKELVQSCTALTSPHPAAPDIASTLKQGISALHPTNKCSVLQDGDPSLMS